MEERFLLSKHQGMQFSSRVNGVMRRSEWRYGLWLRNKFEAGIGSRKTQLPVLILWFDREEFQSHDECSRRINGLTNGFKKVLRSFGRGYRVFFIIMDDKGCDLVHRNTTLGLQKVLKGNVQVEQSVGVPFSMVAVQAQQSGLEVSLYLAVMFLPKIMRWRFRRLRVEYKVLLITKRRSHNVLSSIYIGSQRMDRSFEEVQLDGQVVSFIIVFWTLRCDLALE
ncbi:hypothetical protein Bca52824_001554 [Brassica carinata]|uniref:Uncharacterized protein n=1 Tax=Brassica carinata TaxID=52824 RepID=A0A8X7WGH4_BRACI|nr:hypothetical protein Bca52824_001554 [Brassica carinata]